MRKSRNPAFNAESIESYFLKFALPCTFVLRDLGRVTGRQVGFLERSALRGKRVSRTLLEKTYANAFRRMREVAREMGKESPWDERVIREYFLHRHNGFIKAGDGAYARAPKALKEFCKVVKAKVIAKKPGFLVVRLPNGRTRAVFSHFVPAARVGSKVWVHHGYAVELAAG